MAKASRVYVVSISELAVTTAITLIQIKAGATVPLELLRATMGITNSTTLTQLLLHLLRKTAAATVTSFTPLKLGPTTDPAAAAVGGAAATGINASAEGTDGNVLKQGVFNYVNEWQWIPSEEERIFVDAAGMIGLKLPNAPGASATLSGDMIFQEMA